MLTVDCIKKVSSTVFLTYIVPSTPWSPEYDLYFSNGKGDFHDVTLTTSAIIHQSTGQKREQAATP